MNPGTPLTPAPTQTSPQGVSSVAPTSAPTPPQLPTAPTPQALPQPLQNPTYNPSASLNTIADFYKIPRDIATSVNQTQALGNVQQQQTNANRAAAGIQESNLRDQLNPSKYRVEADPNSQYGVRITNSLGQNTDFSTYVNLTGDNPAEVLAKSSDPGAKQFVQAYQNFEDLMQTMIAASGGDETAKARLGDYYQANPGLQQMTPKQVSELFMQRYGQFFGMPQPQQPNTPGVTPTLQSANNPVTTSPYYNPNFQSAFAANPYQQGSGSDLSAILGQLQSQQSGG